MSVTEIGGWRVSAIAALHDAGGPSVAAGWVKGYIGIDYRAFHWDLWGKLPDEALPWCWALTHLPTGWGIFAFSGTLSETMAMADELAAMTDWSSITPENARFLDRRIQAFADRFPGRVFHPSKTIAPWAERTGTSGAAA